jgi:methanogenic corrinoid protein MtbC1
MRQDLMDAIIGMREPEALAWADKMLERGDDPLAILSACREAMAEVGRRFEAGTYFIPELMLGGEILRQISDLAKPKFAQAEVEREHKGTIVLGTVQGDIHDIGKDIVVFMLDISGFDVLDLGVDVAPDAFVEKVRETGSRILGLSGFLTLAFEPMKQTIEAVEAAGLRKKVRVMIGGGPITEEVRAYTGADAWGSDASAAVRLANEWVDAGE